MVLWINSGLDQTLAVISRHMYRIYGNMEFMMSLIVFDIHVALDKTHLEHRVLKVIVSQGEGGLE